ncbi:MULTISPECIES: hypothetical protein [Glycomyces]|uniref:Uncharacterized protein n=1 Tax=Glycomyces algeriensis TaxID=256037 RepID=A0A9W6G5U3_9ACTN|nr:hypothetical protein [Glycomyces algeriensis]MDA1368397.1 hypothetical protein [Glycomyces algeriensis]MDR7353203.1 hypothetical protein [Glycomyces algeriensis]GLI40897.1 hypothetical protein GALLR39Z86_07470 [Glycomyces algeriensis]
MKLKLDVSDVTFMVSLAPVAKEYDGKHQTDKDGSLKWTTELIALGSSEDEGASVIKVVTTGEKPNLPKGQPVSVVDLEAVPWVSKQGTLGTAYRAAAINLAKAGK